MSASTSRAATAGDGTDPIAFWERAAHRLQWSTPWHTALDWRPPTGDGDGEPGGATWFGGGRLNAAVNAVDRHVGKGERVAIHFEGERGDRRRVTYDELHDEVCRLANVLTELGVGVGDRVVIYLPVLVETVVAVLATARIGAIHSLVFSGFSAEALRARVDDLAPSVVITSDGQRRRGGTQPLKATVDRALDAATHPVDHVLVVRRTGDDTPWSPARDRWWHDELAAAAPTHRPQAFDAETPLFVIHTSGTTGRPKGLVHTLGGYLTQAAWTHRALFDHREDDVYWCTADLAWVTAHTYVLYGPLLNGATQVLYEGTPDTPTWRRHLEVIDRYGVSIYYTAPTLVRALMARFPDGAPADLDVSSLRVLGSVGEPINPEAWRWLHGVLGAARAPVVDTWWQSETGAAMIATLPGDPAKPGVAGRPLPTIGVHVVDDDGAPVPTGRPGHLVLDAPWPAMARTVWGDPARYHDAYFARFADRGWFTTGDGATIDADGDVQVLGRIDDVINVSGHRLSAIEIESALVGHDEVVEAGVAATPDDTTGQAVVAFVVPTTPATPPADADAWVRRGAELEPELRSWVTDEIGPIARPAHVVAVPELPKTRSGKILRRLLGELVTGAPASDTTSLHDPEVPTRIREVVTARGSTARVVGAPSVEPPPPSQAS